MSDVLIKEVKSKKELKQFVDFQNILFKGNRYFVPSIKKNVIETFNKKENPAFDFCDVKLWLAYRGNKISGRIAGIINHAYNAKKNEKYIRFGWLDFTDDKDILIALINTVENWGKECGLEKIHGPIGLTNFDPAGVVVEGFEEITTSSSTFNFPYYPKYLEELGFVKENDWVEFHIPVPSKTPEQLSRIAKIVTEKYDLTIVRPKSMKELLKYGEGVFNVLNQAYKNLYAVLEFNEKQIQYYIKKFLPSLPPRYISIVLMKNEVVAFGISMPSLSRALQKCRGKLFPFGFYYILKALKKNHVVDLMLIAVKPELQNKGLNSIMFDELIPKYLEDGIEYVDTNAEMEDNVKVQSQWKFFEPRLTKRKRSYVKTI
ncbi:MAG: N-acetyltransferase [Bacteroidales bacterium]